MRSVIEKLNALQMKLNQFGHTDLSYEFELSNIEYDIRNFRASWMALESDSKNYIGNAKHGGTLTLGDYLLCLFAHVAVDLSEDEYRRVRESDIFPSILIIGSTIREIMYRNPDLFLLESSVPANSQARFLPGNHVAEQTDRDLSNSPINDIKNLF